MHQLSFYPEPPLTVEYHQREGVSESTELVDLMKILLTKKLVFGDKDFLRFYELRDKFTRHPARLSEAINQLYFRADCYEDKNERLRAQMDELESQIENRVWDTHA